MSSRLALAEPNIQEPARQHWLRLALPAGWRSSAEERKEARVAWRERLPTIGHDLRRFLMVYSAALAATATFIA